jgi:hypothetical protein
VRNMHVAEEDPFIPLTHGIYLQMDLSDEEAWTFVPSCPCGFISVPVLLDI